MKILDEAYEEAWENAHNNDGWKEEKKSDEGDIVYSKKNKKGKKDITSPKGISAIKPEIGIF